jgi:hypothetical protein
MGPVPAGRIKNTYLLDKEEMSMVKASFQAAGKEGKAYAVHQLNEDNNVNLPVALIQGLSLSDQYRVFRVEGDGIIGILYVKADVEIPEKGEITIQ